MSSFIKINTSVSLLTDEHVLLIQTKEEVKTIKMEPQLTQILVEMITLKNQVVTKEHLIETVWEGNQFVGNTALRKNIYKLRNILLQTGSELEITTIPKKGYKLEVKDTKKSQKRKVYKLISYAAASVVLAIFALSMATSTTVDQKLQKSEFQVQEEEEEIILLGENEMNP